MIFFLLAKAKSPHFTQNETTVFNIFQGNENLVSWLPHLLSMFQKPCRSIKHSNCLALRLLGGFQLRLSLQTGLLSLETFTSPLLPEHQGVWCKSRLQCRTQVSELGLGNQGFKQPPWGLTETSMAFCSQDFSQNFLVFQVIPALKHWKVFREICFSHLCLENKGWAACAASLPLMCQSWTPLRGWIGSSLFIYYHLLKNTFNNNRLFAVSLI